MATSPRARLAWNEVKYAGAAAHDQEVRLAICVHADDLRLTIFNYNLLKFNFNQWPRNHDARREVRNAIADTEFRPGRRLRPGCSTWEGPRNVGRAPGAPPIAVPLVGGRCRVRTGVHSAEKGQTVDRRRKKRQKWRRRHDAHGDLLRNGARNDHGARKATLAGTPHLGVAVRIGQAPGELPRTLPLVDGCSRVRIGIIGVRNRPVRAHFLCIRHLGNGCASGAQNVGLVYNKHTNITFIIIQKFTWNLRMGFWGFGVIINRFVFCLKLAFFSKFRR